MDSAIEKVMGAVKDVEKKLTDGMNERIKTIKEEGQQHVKDSDSRLTRLEKEHKEFTQELEGKLTEVQKQLGRISVGGDGQPQDAMTIGEAFVKHERFLKRGRGESFTIDFEEKSISKDPASAGSLEEPQILPFWPEPKEPHIRDLLRVGRTSKSTIKMPRRKLRTNNAAMVAEGALKPESDLTFETVQTTVRKIAHFMKISDEALDDIPMLSGYINADLADGLMDEEDRQILKGDNTGENLEGLYTVAQQFSRAQPGDTKLETFVKVATQLRLVNRNLTGYVMNPVDWEEVMLLKGTDGHYIWANHIDSNGRPRIRAKPVRDTTHLAPGEWLAGDFKAAAKLFDRRETSIQISRQNEDDFIRNMVTILGEKRLALFIFDPFSLVKNAPA